eukprot:15431537-Alexandrium_andersonii.AAC.1
MNRPRQGCRNHANAVSHDSASLGAQASPKSAAEPTTAAATKQPTAHVMLRTGPIPQQDCEQPAVAVHPLQHANARD